MVRRYERGQLAGYLSRSTECRRRRGQTTFGGRYGTPLYSWVRSKEVRGRVYEGGWNREGVREGVREAEGGEAEGEVGQSVSPSVGQGALLLCSLTFDRLFQLRRVLLDGLRNIVHFLSSRTEVGGKSRERAKEKEGASPNPHFNFFSLVALLLTVSLSLSISPPPVPSDSTRS